MLPSAGHLTCTFNSSSVRRAVGVMESSKLSTLLKQLRLQSMSDRERLELVAMFAPFAFFWCKQISSIIRTFSVGSERVTAAALLFTRAADAATNLVSLTSMMSGHDLLGWRDLLGWYGSYRWNMPTGGRATGLQVRSAFPGCSCVLNKSKLLSLGYHTSNTCHQLTTQQVEH